MSSKLTWNTIVATQVVLIIFTLVDFLLLYSCHSIKGPESPTPSYNCVCRIQCNPGNYILGGYRECSSVSDKKEAEKLAAYNCENSDRMGLCTDLWDPFCECVCYMRKKGCR